ncbi:2-methoxy-6-polyprenyl-1,4-benzoquinol methylase, mitochondrial [Anopheles ziemanni]|uniref:2-methoxy-6-polyprenyl-1,4-benzoquinol methylase, mitochondrial n=1 Tax=Anopheles coustani TaxID=139045 RepID=UPI0026599702|nr:2-methoxy-6-polyprenyl-1,4-benzoquinol methylase, mitochondrial [Anopheles coustani]XP_058172742.1 2-methoxy-6-polyprenyl-1,4-benzoquinol methylase, mitochondrial [Anopheles ziemanni]
MSLLRRLGVLNRQKILFPLVKFSTKTVGDVHDSPTNESETHFGFETVKESEKWKKVHKVFEEVAASYDLMNDAMSMGVHRVWKDIFMERLGPVGNGIRLLDMAGGTGDISFRYMKYLQSLPSKDRASSHVTVCDINQNMLDVGQKRWEKLNLQTAGDSIDWVCADAEKLPFDDNTYTVYTIAFGIRNCTHIDQVLKEAYRVLKPGGRFMCLEFSHVNNEYLKWLYDQYSFQVIPPMGQILANQWQPYQYLVESIRKFPLQRDFKIMIENAGFKCVHYENLSFGVVAIHSGFKL